MIVLAWALAWCAVVAWLLARAIRQSRAYETLEPADDHARDLRPTVAVIVPARNEARDIEACVEGLVGQDYPPDRIRILVIDDHSIDDTAARVEAIAQREPRVSLIPSDPLPERWLGKPHACAQGARAGGDAAWLCFVDADTAPQPALVRRAVDVAQERCLDMLSLEPRQVLGGFFERLIIPCGLFLCAFALDLRRVNDPQAPAAAATANGQFILIRAKTYHRVGGHAAVRDRVSEDAALARRVKAHGGQLALMGAESLFHTRMYHGLGELWRGLSNTASEMFGGNWPTACKALGAVALAGAAVALPVVGILAAAGEPGWPHLAAAAGALAASAAMFAAHVAGARHLGASGWYGLLFPLGYVLAAMIGLYAVAKRLRGRTAWKGRVCALPPTGAGEDGPSTGRT